MIPLSAIDKDHADAYFEHMHPVLPISPWSNTKELARDLQSVPSATVSGLSQVQTEASCAIAAMALGIQACGAR